MKEMGFIARLKSRSVGDDPWGTPEVKLAEDDDIEFRLITAWERFERKLCMRVKAEFE